MLRTFAWHCEPPEWRDEGGTLSIVTGRDTDFWQSTFYGFRRDDGHFRATFVDGDFTAEVLIVGRYETLYDQAGLMVRVDERNWVKAGVEYTDGLLHFSTVVTRDGFSDWSVVPLGPADEPVRLRVTRHGETVRVQYERPAGWQMARLAFLAMPEAVAVGPMACSPQRSGFQVNLIDFTVGPPIDRALHAD